jgi:Undecaprenyl-phosphate galactose phosphotransferase WbaP
VRDFGGILGFSSTHNLTKPISLLWKRCIDLLLLLISSPITIPVTVFIALIVKITSPGPIFYGHKRIGKNGREFKCWKFRSMVIDADKQLEKILAENPEMRAEWEKDRKFTNDPRVTKIGKILRKTSIDEIPQFFNILTGEMSFIGPRPVTEPELAKYGKKSDFILSVQPGLSGMWQISGRSDTGYEERVTLDSYYIQNWSVWLDIWIIIKTVYVVLRGKGAY